MQPGIAKAVVKHHWFTTSQGGTPGLSVRVSLSDDWDTDVEMVGTIWMSQKSMGMARPQLKALGFDCTTQELSELDDTDILVGNQLEVELKEEEYKGRRELKISRFGGPLPKPTKDALKATTLALRAAKKETKEADVKSVPQQQPKGESLTSDARKELAKAKRPPDPDITKANQSFDEAMAEVTGQEDIPFAWLLPLVMAAGMMSGIC